VRIFLPDAEAIAQADSKWETYQILLRAGVAVPRTAAIQTPADLERFFAEIETRPIWVRGSGAPGIGIGVASLPCRTVAHAHAWVDHHQGWGGFIASEYLPGRNLTWCGIYAKGKLIAAQSRERLEYVLPHVSPSGITGAPAVSRTIVRKDLHETGDRAVRALSGPPHGIYFVDFKEDAAALARVTEINAGRFGTTIHFYSEAGCNFPLLALRLAFNEAVAQSPLLDPIPPNWYWIRTLDCGPVLVHLDS
jgi:carbamoyl-phosphate synthase large subunit